MERPRAVYPDDRIFSISNAQEHMLFLWQNWHVKWIVTLPKSIQVDSRSSISEGTNRRKEEDKENHIWDKKERTPFLKIWIAPRLHLWSVIASRLNIVSPFLESTSAVSGSQNELLQVATLIMAVRHTPLLVILSFSQNNGDCSPFYITQLDSYMWQKSPLEAH